MTLFEQAAEPMVTEEAGMGMPYAPTSPEPRPQFRRPASGAFLEGTEFPDWFWPTPLSDVPLTAKLAKTLSHLATVGDLRGMPVGFLLETPGLGPTSPERLRGRLISAFDKALRNRKLGESNGCGASRTDDAHRMPAAVAGIPVAHEAWDERRRAMAARSDVAPPRYDLSEPLVDHILAGLHLLRGREAEVLCRRFGFVGAVTGQEVLASEFGLSQARVWQIQLSARARMDAATGCFEAIRVRLHALASGGFVDVGTVHAETWAAGMPGLLVQYLAADLAGLYALDLPWGGRVFAPFGQAVLDGHLRALSTALRAIPVESPAELAAEGFASLIRAEEPERRALLAIVGEFLAGRDCISAMCGLGMQQHAAFALVARAPHGIAIEAVREMFVGAAKHVPTTENIREWLCDLAVHVGKGIYVLRKSSPAAKSLATLCGAAISQGIPGRIWGIPDLMAALRASGADLPPDLDEVGLELALVLDGSLHRVKPRRWRMAGTKPSASPEQLAEAILERHGAPMRSTQLSKAAFELWGPRKGMQLRPVGRLVMLGSGLWGLLDRDLGVRDADAVVAAALEEFASGKRGAEEIYLSLVARDAHGGLANVDLLAALLRTKAGLLRIEDGTFRAAGEGLRHRVGSMPSMVLQVLSEAPDGLHTGEATLAVAALSPLKPARGYVQAMLQRYGHRGGSGKWFADAARAAADPATRGVEKIAHPSAHREYPKLRKPASAKRQGTHWEDADVRTLKEMWADGATALNISIALEGRVSRSAVLSKIHRLSLQRRDLAA